MVCLRVDRRVDLGNRRADVRVASYYERCSCVAVSQVSSDNQVKTTGKSGSACLHESSDSQPLSNDRLNMADTNHIQDRAIRVFVSSTFRDMREEREALIKRVFPQLRKLCNERGVAFTDVDLRWGITEEQAERGEVLPTCFAEIDRCRPFFIGLLGHRYGWVPHRNNISPALFRDHPWLADYSDRSITELEILHGVLNNPALATRTRFYFRDACYLKQVPDDQREDFVESDPAARAKLELLKERIRNSGLTLRDDYADSDALAKLVLDDLTAAINEEFPEGSQLEPLNQEAAQHEAIACNHTRVFIANRDEFKRLDEHVTCAGPPLLVVGESGVGKSALLANWAMRFRKSHPDDFLLLHFIGDVPDSADPIRMLRRIMLEIKQRFDLQDDVPADPSTIVGAFPDWLAKTPVSQRTVLIFDGLSRLQQQDNTPAFAWLPLEFPPNFRLMLATRPGVVLNSVRQQQWPELCVQPLSLEARKELIIRFLRELHSKQLSDDQLLRIASQVQTSNPLFLRAVLDELRQFGDYERLNERIDYYLWANDPAELYERILERWEQDFSREVVRDSLSLIWASRHGLSEAEVQSLLGKEEVLPRAIWTPFYLASEASLTRQAGLLQFCHDYLRNAVEKRYITDDRSEDGIRNRLAGFFSKQDFWTNRKADELPWQWARMRQWRRLHDAITDLGCFRLRNENELRAYWLMLPQEYDPEASYTEAWEQWRGELGQGYLLADHAEKLGLFFRGFGRSTVAASFFERAMLVSKQALGADHESTLSASSNFAMALQDIGEYRRAEPLCRQILKTRQRRNGDMNQDTLTSLNNLASIVEHLGQYAESKRLYQQTLNIAETLLGANHVTTLAAANNLGLLLQRMGDLSEAEVLFRRVVKAAQRVLGGEHQLTLTAIGNLCGAMRLQGNADEAEQVQREALTVCERAFGVDHPMTLTFVNNLALALDDQGLAASAERLYRRAVEGRKRVLGEHHPATLTAIENLARSLKHRGRLAQAEQLLKDAYENRLRTLGANHPSTADCLHSLAHLCETQEDFKQAEIWYRQVLTTRELLYGADHRKTLTTLDNLGVVLGNLGEFTDGQEYIERAYAGFERTLGPLHPDSLIAYGNLALILDKRGEHAEAEALHRHGVALNEQALGPEHPTTLVSLSNLATGLRERGRLDEAKSLYQRVLEVRLRVLGKHHRKTIGSQVALAQVFAQQGDHLAAEALYVEASNSAVKCFGPDSNTTVDVVGGYAWLLIKIAGIPESKAIERIRKNVPGFRQGDD